MFVGESRARLKQENMPTHEYVKDFAMQVLKYLPEYEFASEHHPSRVILLAKKKYHKKTWIDFEKFFTAVNKKSSPKNLDAMKYSTASKKITEDPKDSEVNE